MKKAILFAVGIAVCAASPAFAANSCLRLDEIYNFNALDDKTLIVEDNSHDKFRVNLLGTCPLLTFKQGLAFKSFGGTALSCISGGDDVITRDPAMGRQRCAIKSVEPYTAAMQKADADAAAAKKAAEH